LKKKLLIFFLILLFPIFLFIVDYRRAVHDLPPIFAVRTQIYKDGGTSVYRGLGYKVIDYNQLDGGRKDVVFQSIIVSKGQE
jgi:hypothetical protein